MDVIRQGTPTVKKVATVRTVCNAMNMQTAHKTTLSEVHKLLRLLTIALTSATAERTFFAVRRLLTEKKLNIVFYYTYTRI